MATQDVEMKDSTAAVSNSSAPSPPPVLTRYASCMYPSSGGMSILNGTVPTGSSTGLSPMAPIADGARSLFINMWLLLPLTSFLLAVIIFSEHL